MDGTLTPSAIRARGDDEMTHLLQDLAPELSLRWVSRLASLSSPPALSPLLFRGLVGIALRASLPGDSASAIDVLELALTLPQEDPLSPLGFTSATPLTTLHDILEDLVEAAINGILLKTNSPALRFYSTAGVGTSDEAEYDSDDGSAEQHLRFRMHRPSLSLVRSENVVFVLRYMAMAFKKLNTDIDCQNHVNKHVDADIGSSRSKLEQNSERNDSCICKKRQATLRELPNGNLLKLYFRTFPSKILSLPSETVHAVQDLFSAILQSEDTPRHVYLMDEYITTLSDLSSQKGSLALGTFIRSVASPTLRMEAAMKCLQVIFKARPLRKSTRKGCNKVTSDSSGLHISQFVNCFVKPLLCDEMSEKAQTGVPALLTALAESWLACGSSCDFIVDQEQFTKLTSYLQESIVQLERHKAATVARDVASTGVALFAVCARVQRDSSEVWEREGIKECRGACDFHKLL